MTKRKGGKIWEWLSDLLESFLEIIANKFD